MIQEDIKLLKREIEIMKQVDHVNILKLIEIYEDDDKVYIVMELVEGSELFVRIVDKGYYSEKSTVHIVKQILNAVKYLHQQGIAHRDLKSSNILVRHSLTLALTDFGMSLCLDEKTISPIQQQQIGTPRYMAPEILLEKHNPILSDIWSLGVILYELLDGTAPLSSCVDLQHLVSCLSKGSSEITYPEHFSNNMTSLLKSIFQNDPKTRFTTEEIQNYLEDVLTGQPQ